MFFFVLVCRDRRNPHFITVVIDSFLNNSKLATGYYDLHTTLPLPRAQPALKSPK